MDVGKMRHLIKIEKMAGQVRDTGGGYKPLWVPVASVWADIRPISGREQEIARQNKMQITHEVKIRYRTDLNKAGRFIHDGRIFDIQTMRDLDERKNTLILYCKEG